MALQLPHATAADSARLSANFAKLPSELKLMVIGYAVSRSRYIDLRKYGKVRRKLTFPFAADDDLEMAREEFDKVNTFTMQPMNNLGMQPARNVVHLRVHFTITCKGADYRLADPFRPLSVWDTIFLGFIPTFFTKLEALTVVLDNSGSVANGATYCDLSGQHFPAASLPDHLATERMIQMSKWMDEVEFLSLPDRRRGFKSKRRLLLKHSNSSSGQSRSTFRFRAPYANPGFEERMCQIHDAPRAMLFFGNDAPW